MQESRCHLEGNEELCSKSKHQEIEGLTLLFDGAIPRFIVAWLRLQHSLFLNLIFFLSDCALFQERVELFKRFRVAFFVSAIIVRCEKAPNKRHDPPQAVEEAAKNVD